MSTIGTRGGRGARLVQDTRAEPTNSAAEPLPAKTPYWLLWSTGIAALVLGIVAFALWGTNGAVTLIDMMVALCT
jgi:hypothetical protein